MQLMIETHEPPAIALPSRRRRHRRRIVLAVVAVVIVAAGAITAVTVSLRYAHAAALRCGCALSWRDSGPVRSVDAGPWSASEVTARPGTVQTFYVLVINPASVTQTVFGHRDDPRDLDEPTELAIGISRGSALADQGEPDASRYTSGPVRLAPHAVRWLRMSIHTSSTRNWHTQFSESWTNLVLRVRVGAFTRTETVDFDNSAMVITGTENP